MFRVTYWSFGSELHRTFSTLEDSVNFLYNGEEAGELSSQRIEDLERVYWDRDTNGFFFEYYEKYNIAGIA